MPFIVNPGWITVNAPPNLQMRTRSSRSHRSKHFDVLQRGPCGVGLVGEVIARGETPVTFAHLWPFLIDLDQHAVHFMGSVNSVVIEPVDEYKKSIEFRMGLLTENWCRTRRRILDWCWW